MAAIITKEERWANLQDHIAGMPPLSATVTKLMDICNNPRTSPNDLIRVISLDPVLTGKVLSFASSIYPSHPNKVNTLARAIILLGLNTVINLALNSTVFESIGTISFYRALSMNTFWSHSICVGVTAKTMAAILNIPLKEHEKFFVAGLLHDLGKIPLNMSYPDEYNRIFETAGLQHYLIEDSTFGFDHCKIGEMIAQKWNLDSALIDSICHHHHPDEALEENRLLTAIVALGNIYANMVVEPSIRCRSDSQIIDDLVKKINISWPTLVDQKDTIVDEIEQAKIFLKV